jgi:predicted aldo/keto reductase-like oxidoreductase
MKSQDDVRRNLENTLKKLRSSYVDVYLIHCITKGNWDEIKARKILDEFEKFRSEGLIRGIGFSYHGQFPTFKDVISGYHWDMCMVQQNFMDVESEATAEAIHVAGEKGCALAIMEPLRGGGLATPPKSIQAVYDAFPVKRSAVEWAFRHLANYKEVSAIVSGVTTLEQLKENIEIFNKPDLLPGCLSGDEAAVLARVRGMYQSFASIPCTGCEYCMPCPNGVNISGVFSRYNDSVMFGHSDQSRRSYFFVSNSKQGVSQCTACGVCEDKCPQNIPIVKDLQTAHAALKGWIE